MPILLFAAFDNADLASLYRTFSIPIPGLVGTGVAVDVDIDAIVMNNATREIAIRRTRWIPVDMDRPIWNMFMANMCSVDTLTEDSFIMRCGPEQMLFVRVYQEDLYAAGRKHLRSRCRPSD